MEKSLIGEEVAGETCLYLEGASVEGVEHHQGVEGTVVPYQ